MYGQYDVVTNRKAATWFRDWDSAREAEGACLERFHECEVELVRNGGTGTMVQLSDLRTGQLVGFVRDVLASSPRRVWS